MFQKVVSPFRFLVYTNLWISILVALFTLETYFVFDWVPDAVLISHTFFATLFVYNVLRLSKANTVTDGSLMLQWIERNKNMAMAMAGIGAVGAGITLFFLTWNAMIVAAGLGVVSMWYGISPVKGIGTLRNIPFAKVFLIALSYAGVVVLLPVVNEVGWDLPPQRPGIFFVQEQFFFWVWFVCITAFVLAITLPFDIRDVNYDKQAGLRTLPVVAGIGFTKVLAFIALTPAALILSIPFLMQVGGNSAVALVPAIVLGVWGAVSIVLSEPTKSDLFYAFIVEGTMVIHFIMVWWLFT